MPITCDMMSEPFEDFDDFVMPDYQKQSHNYETYRTGEELMWINMMRLKNPDICRKYCELVVSGMRAWDAGVDPARIIKNCQFILAEMESTNVSESN